MSNLLARLNDMLFPERATCNCCSREALTDTYCLCADCRAQLTKIEHPCPHCGAEGRRDGLCDDCVHQVRIYTQAASVYGYAGTASILIKKLKYHNARYIAPYLAKMLQQKIKELEWPIDLITSVPMHKRAIRRRGYNQAELLAKHLATGIGIAYCVVLRRIRDTPQQAGLSREDRLKNLTGAFVLHPKAKLVGRRILLIDDVHTTGATADACANALLSAGAVAVWVLTVASGGKS